ncbi:MAG: aminodeoxychorismate synthase, component I [Candidatus Accumulibacter sp. 66-26]|nr:aminodeoxychorismate synthase component I [Accumulibacter sp.]OJW46462.1 MAG: aminodeoxychorismate synthase, component I [Candidatus Accumulibacter sp. 66-26]
MPAASPDSHFALFDGDDGGAQLFTGWRRTLSFDADADFAEAFAEIEAATAAGEWVALLADYALGACFETRAAGEGAAVQAPGRTPVLRAAVFGRAERLTAQALAVFLAGRLAALPEAARTAGVADVAAGLGPEAYAAAVRRIKQWIGDGDCYQINFTFPLACRLYGDPLALYAALRARQPVRYGGYLATPETRLLSLSPELFFERRGARVWTRPMKGTAPRGATPADDARRRDALLASAKERAENVMIVDLLRNDLGRLAAPGKVRVEALCEAEAYPTLWQMVSTVAADVPGASLFDLFRALFPCGSITGAPKIRAMQLIAELETPPRGLYTGAFGWIAPGGDCRFNVAIRTLEIAEPDSETPSDPPVETRAEGRVPGLSARLGVGSGIVIDADPAREYAECLLKANFLTGFDPGFELIETLRLENGRYPRLALHLERLQASARALGFACAAAEIAARLVATAESHPVGVYRVRLTLAHGGACALRCAPLAADEGLPWRAVLAGEALDAGDYLLRHKTTARARYDRALAALPADVFDALFLNTRGEVCEGARSNVFVERGGMLLTPPLASGLLPGVLRRELIESGRAVECVLRVDDLRAAPTIYLGNALRGLITVRLEP